MFAGRQSPSSDGGAMKRAGTVRVNDSVVTHNHSAGGGAISSYGT